MRKETALTNLRHLREGMMQTTEYLIRFTLLRTANSSQGQANNNLQSCIWRRFWVFVTIAIFVIDIINTDMKRTN
jgi:hypothetical protein